MARQQLEGLLEPSSVVRFALEAHLDAYRARGDAGRATGRQALAQAMGIGEPRLSELLNSGPENLRKLSLQTEEAGLAPLDSVTRLVRQVQLTGREDSTIHPVWWPRMRVAYSLGTPGGPVFRNSVEVLMAAESFAAYHARLLERPPEAPQHSLTQSDELSCTQLLSRLCRFASGPYGVAHESHRLISQLAPLAPNVVTDFISSGTVTTQVIQSLDRSLRRATWNDEMKRQYKELLAKPPDKIYRRTNWMRALRRLKLSGNHSQEAEENDSDNWILEQFLLALEGKPPYQHARITDRRYAFWCLAELAPKGDFWSQAQNIARNSEETKSLLPGAVELREYLHGLPRQQRDAFRFQPSVPWLRPYLRGNLYDLLAEDQVESKKSYRHRANWAWGARPRTIRQSMELLSVAIFDPDVVRQRAAMDAVRAAGPEVVQSVSNGAIVILDQPEPQELPIFVIERCLATLGALQQANAIDVVERAVRGAEGEVLVQAVAAAGDLAHAHPGKSLWLMGSTATAVNQSRMHEDVVLAGISAFVSYRRDPRENLQEALELRSAPIDTTLRWSDAVLADPLLPPSGAPLKGLFADK